MVFLDLKCEGQVPLVEAKVDLDDGSSTGTNNKWKILLGLDLLDSSLARERGQFYLLYKHQWNTRWPFGRKHKIFTREKITVAMVTK